jgi:hypothetical protein
VDVLAASLALEDKGSQFSPHFWSLQRSKMEAAFSREKRLMITPEDPPALVAVDVPGIGPRVYDADLIRSLIATELFPYRMKVISKPRDGTRVRYIKLDPTGGYLAKTCFAEVKNSKAAACPNALKPKEHGTADFSPASLIERFQVNGLVSSDSEASDGATGSPKKDEIPDLRKVLAALPADDERIELRYREIGVHCFSPSELETSEKDVIGSGKDDVLRVCRLRLDLTIPRSAASAYFQLAVKGVIIKPANTVEVYCGPDHFQITEVDHTVKPAAGKQPAHDFHWSLYDRVLRPLETNDQEFEILVPIPKVVDDKDPVAIKITLEGWPKPWLASWLIGKQTKNWCYPDQACQQGSR